MTSDYLKFRGKCKEYCDKAIQEDPSLRLARGHYYCPVWNTWEEHWWTVRKDGTILDPTARQFPSKGTGIYEEFDGYFECANCGKRIKEEDVQYAASRYVFCSGACHYGFVMM